MEFVVKLNVVSNIDSRPSFDASITWKADILTVNAINICSELNIFSRVFYFLDIPLSIKSSVKNFFTDVLCFNKLLNNITQNIRLQFGILGLI